MTAALRTGRQAGPTRCAARAPRRLSTKGATPALRLAGLRLAAAVVDGLNPLDRSAAAVHGEAWRLYDKFIKVGGAS